MFHLDPPEILYAHIVAVLPLQHKSNNNRLDVRKILFNEDEHTINYPTHIPIVDGKARVKYFRTLEVYALYLGLTKQRNKTISIISK